MSKQNKSNSIRIIGGNWRGRRLPVIDIEGLRPTTDRVRETLFNWLMHDISGSSCLDLFAGSGALGLECLSRGAESVQFVDSDEQVRSVLEENLQRLEVQPGQAEVVRADACNFVSRPASGQFDLVFLDPPFKSRLLSEVAQSLEQNNWLKQTALIYVERPLKQESLGIPDNWQVLKQGKAGQSAYCLYARRA